MQVGIRTIGTHESNLPKDRGQKAPFSGPVSKTASHAFLDNISRYMDPAR